ncbi:putative short-chain dehydrogenase/reductase [Rickenella mellea]|uniref:Putative short-chain dehydrogenase/reductase n=1 Tax=Rickenella mellea TaxID=50990 RepID=A0A4Y7PK51_9AGAM|nr:putative short-chain dehydrogenase/reductase [Rickenella mellea]
MHTEKSNRMRGKVAIITGAGSRGHDIGNGRATAILMARAGAKVVLVDINREWVEETERMIKVEHDFNEKRTLVVTANVTHAKDCARTVEYTRQTFGRLDILVNVVGIDGPSGTAVDVDTDDWERAMKVNLTSMVLMTKYAIPEMLRTRPEDISKGSGKAIVNMSSVSGLQGGHHSLFYPTSKGAIVNLTRAMAAHHGHDGIRVNAVAPGMVYTPMVTAGGMTQELRDARRERSLLKIEGYGWDVGNAIVFLCTEEARWVTGATLVVDAGATAGYTAGTRFGEPGQMAKL